MPEFDMFNSTSNEGQFMDEKQLQALANELAKNLKTPEDLNQFDRLLDERHRVAEQRDPACHQET
ncbi:TPA: hypothetical protein JC757_005080 [Salmonella enterica subsp. diarizonae]|nr:hypothetical protein [Salmonella enterica subsp. diarizonae]